MEDFNKSLKSLITCPGTCPEHQRPWNVDGMKLEQSALFGSSVPHVQWQIDMDIREVEKRDVDEQDGLA